MLRSSSRLFPQTKRLLYASKSFNHIGRKAEENVREKLMKLSSTALNRYNEIIGFDEIDKAYKKVTILQEDLAKAQTDRTNLQLQINHIRQDLANLQSQIQDCKRGEARYIELMKNEYEILQEINRLEEKFEIIDNQERELFAHLQSKINILHEKSRSHTRQWGVISTIIGALLGIIGTSISAYLRNNDIRRVQQDFQAQFQAHIDQITKDNQKIISGYNDMMLHLQKFDFVGQKPKEAPSEATKNRESWASYLGRKTVSVWRWCTFQKAQ